MKNVRLKGLLTIAVMFVMMFAFTVVGYAASGSVTFGSNSYSVEAGKEFNIGVYVKSDVNVGAYTFSITYDSDKIEYVSGADAASAGILSFAGYPNSTYKKIWLTFKAKEAGSCTIAVTNPYLGPSDSSHGDSLTISKASSAPITIKGGSSTGGNTGGNTGSASGSADLKSIWIEETGFYGFKADVTEYDITVDNELEKITVTAKAADSNATVTISDTNLKVGANNIYITVKATDGTTKKYTVIVRRKQGSSTTTTTPSQTTTPTPTTTPEPDTTPAGPTELPDVDMSRSLFAYNDIPLYFCKGFDNVRIPSGYTQTGITINNDYQADALVNDSGSKILLNLTSAEDKPGKLYVYLVADGTIYPYLEITNDDSTYVFDGSYNTEGIPDGYEEMWIGISSVAGENIVVNAWHNDEAEGFYLFRASCEGGASELYQYDEKEGTIQRFNKLAASAVGGSTSGTAGDSDEVVKLKAEIEGLKAQNKSEMKIWLIIVVILAVVCVLLLVGIFFMFNKMRDQQEYAEYEDEDEEYYDEEDTYDNEGIEDNRTAYFGNEDDSDDKIMIDDDESDDNDIDDNDFTFL